MKLANPLNRFKDKAQAFLVARQASDWKDFAVYKNSRKESNTYIAPKEKDRRKKRRKIAKQSRQRNRA